MRRPIQTLALSVALLCAGARAVLAEGSMNVALHEARRIPLAGAAATVVVGDPNVADVSMSDKHSLILMGRGYGVTQLTVTDASGRVLLESQVNVVSPDVGRVTVYRGLTTSEFACGGGRCHSLGETTSTGGGATSGGGGVDAAPVSASPVGPVNSQAVQPSPQL